MEWALRAPMLSAHEAERWGLVNHVVPQEQLEEATMEWAKELALGPTLVYGFTKSAIIHGWEATPEKAYEYQGQALQYGKQTEDYGEGRRAFLEKRPPQFKGR